MSTEVSSSGGEGFIDTDRSVGSPDGSGSSAVGGRGGIGGSVPSSGDFRGRIGGSGKRAGTGGSSRGSNARSGTGTGEVRPEDQPQSGLSGIEIRQGDKRPEYRIMLQGFLCAAFGTIATMTNHDHWIKSPAEVEPIVGPLCRMIESLPKSALKSLEKNWNPIALAGGVAFTLVPDVAYEIKLRRDAKNEVLGEGGSAQTIKPNNQARQTALRNNRSSREHEERSQNGDDAWSVTLPAEDLLINYQLPD